MTAQGSSPESVNCVEKCANLYEQDSIGEQKIQSELDNKFIPKKIKGQYLADVYEAIDMYLRSERVRSCGSFLEWHLQSETSKLVKANFCKDRLCPMCNWRRSLKVFGQISRVMDVLEQGSYRFLFLTLTVKNCSSDLLSSVLDSMQSSFVRMMRNRMVSPVICGSVRIMEITYNPNTDEYHPHMHIIFAVKPDYFHKSYISQSQWTDLWCRAARLDYRPIVHIQTIKESSKGISGAVAEVAKYAVKDSDYITDDLSESIKRVSDLLNSISYRRLLSYSGVFKSVAASLRLDDAENGNLVHVNDDVLRPDIDYIVVRYRWASGFYEKY